MGRGLVVGRHIDLQLDSLLSVQFSRTDHLELTVSDLGADTGRVEGKPEDELRMPLTPEVPEVIYVMTIPESCCPPWSRLEV
jgi:hypothetical protein